jgi:predicted DNA-binding transcriptional regulator YafY
MKEQVTLLTEHARVLLCISTHPESTVRQLAKALDTSERQVFRWLNDLQRAGYLTRAKEGRRNRYLLKIDAPLQELSADGLILSELLALAARSAAAGGGQADTVEAHRLRSHRLRPSEAERGIRAAHARRYMSRLSRFRLL